MIIIIIIISQPLLFIAVLIAVQDSVSWPLKRTLVTAKYILVENWKKIRIKKQEDRKYYVQRNFVIFSSILIRIDELYVETRRSVR